MATVETLRLELPSGRVRFCMVICRVIAHIPSAPTRDWIAGKLVPHFATWIAAGVKVAD